MSNKSLYERLGGYDAIRAVVNNLLPRLQADAVLGRFWQNRGADGIEREKQLLVDFLCAQAGGPMYYTARDMVLSHRGMKVSERDWMIPQVVSVTASTAEARGSIRLEGPTLDPLSISIRR